MERLCVAKTKVCGDLRMLFMQQNQGVLQRIQPNRFIKLHNIARCATICNGVLLQ